MATLIPEDEQESSNTSGIGQAGNYEHPSDSDRTAEDIFKPADTTPINNNWGDEVNEEEQPRN